MNNKSTLVTPTSSTDTTIEEYFKPGVDHNTIYFQIIDKNGQVSYLHDSGQDPTVAARVGYFTLNVVKKEYNEGRIQELDTPIKVNYGRQIANLNRSHDLIKSQVKDNGLYYIVNVPYTS